MVVGYGVVEMSSDSWRPIKYGCIHVRSKADFADKLKQIHTAITKIISETAADVMSVEDVFVSCNAKASLKLGHARGVILLAAAQMNLSIVEYSPREIKQAVLDRAMLRNLRYSG